MANADSSISLASAPDALTGDGSSFSLASSSSDALTSEENATMPINSRISELNESRAELFSRIQGLKQDLQNWRSKLDSQVKTHREELSEMKKSLSLEVEGLRSEFEGLKTTLQQQHEDVVNSLKTLGLEDCAYVSEETKETEDSKLQKDDDDDEEEGSNGTDKKPEQH